MDPLKTAERIDHAVIEVTAAENALGKVIGELHSGARAQKVTITMELEQAFGRLRKSRVELEKLRAILAGEAPEDD